jgi:hypothetical protein
MRTAIAHATVLMLLTAGVAIGQQPLVAIPATVLPAVKASLTAARVELETRIDAHNRRIDAFKARCGAVLATQTALIASCTQDYRATTAEATALEAEKTQFAARVAAATPAAVVNTDPSVVDGRGPLTSAEMVAKVPALAASPAADRIAKGFAAMSTHDWPVALAWWRDALSRDPNNAPLRRSVELAQWMVDYQKHHPRPIRQGAAVQPSPRAAAPMSAHDAREQEFFVQMALETITGTKPMPGVNLSDDWWRDHGK